MAPAAASRTCARQAVAFAARRAEARIGSSRATSKPITPMTIRSSTREKAVDFRVICGMSSPIKIRRRKGTTGRSALVQRWCANEAAAGDRYVLNARSYQDPTLIPRSAGEGHDHATRQALIGDIGHHCWNNDPDLGCFGRPSIGNVVGAAGRWSPGFIGRRSEYNAVGRYGLINPLAVRKDHLPLSGIRAERCPDERLTLELKLCFPVRRIPSFAHLKPLIRQHCPELIEITRRVHDECRFSSTS